MGETRADVGMSPAKSQILYDRYPCLYRQKDLSMMESCLHWGIECDDGWFQLLDDLCARITLLERCGVAIEWAQQKQKFGTLRAYYDIVALPDQMRASQEERDHLCRMVAALVSQAENTSAQTCERTGEYGSLYRTPGGQLKTLSDEEAARDAECGWQKVGQ